MEKLKQSYSNTISISVLIFSIIIINSVYSFAQSGTKWATNGNNTNPGDFIGTINDAPLEIKVNNALALYIKSNGFIFINSFLNYSKGLVTFNSDGQLIPLSYPNDANKVFLGDGSFGSIPFPSNFWQLHDPDIFTMTPGNIGIGIDHPLYKLDVLGSVRISENLYVGGGIIITEKVNASKEIVSGSLKADSILMDSTKAFYGYSKFAGDVKLENKLDVNGNTNINGNLNTTGHISFGNLGTPGNGIVLANNNGELYTSPLPNSTSKVLLGDGTWGTIPYPQNYWQMNNNDLYTTTPGNIGIGTSHPLVKLDIDGDVRISQNLYVGGGLVISDKVNATQELKSAALRADSIIMDSTKAVYGDSRFVGDVKLESKLKVNGDAQINGNFTTAGNITFASNKTISFIPSTGGNPESICYGYQPPNLQLDPCYYPQSPSNIFKNMLLSWGNQPPTQYGSGGQVNVMMMGFDGSNGIIDLSGTSDQPELAPRLLINYGCGKDVFINTGPKGGNIQLAGLGKVGIGILPDVNSPKLDVLGDVRISSLLPNNIVQVGANGILTSVSAGSLGVGLWQQSTNGNDISNTNTGNIGIGTNTPGAKLDIQGGWVKIGDASNNNAIQFETQSGFHRIAFNELRFWDWDSNNGTDMVTFKNGNVGIGTTSPSSRLQVKVDAQSTDAFSIYEGATMNFLVKSDGKVWAREVTVLLTAPLGDFVFDKDYHLITLKELEDYVTKNRHLPGIPSAGDVSKGGINVGEFQNLLLQKIEEMSLYIIQLEKRINELEK